MKNLFWTALVCAVFTASGARAQDETPKTVQVRFRVFGWDNASADLNYTQAGKDTGVEVYEGVRSVFYHYTGPSVLAFYRLKPGADGKMEKIPVVEADLTDAGPWPLILFFPEAGAPGKYKVQVLPDDLKSFPAGSFKIANYSNFPIGGTLGSQAFDLRPTEMKTFMGQTAANATTLFVTLYSETPQGRKTVYTNNWAFQPLMRTIVFIRQSSDSSTGIVARRIIESAVFPKDNTTHPTAQGGG